MTAAVKVCDRSAVDRACYERELRGAKLYRSIPACEGLVRLLDYGECDWGFYLAMELADDEFGMDADDSSYRPKTLARVIAGERALPVGECLKLGLALAEGLITLQSHHLLHRDVKPGNVVYVRGRPVLSDIGLLVDEAEAASLVGTPGYVPPESFVGAGGDVYSLGLTLKAASFGRAVEDLDRGPTLEADTANPLFPAWWRILNKATHPDVTQRYRSAKALRKELRSLRRRNFLLPFTRRASLAVNIVIGALIILFCAYLFKQRADQEKYAARQTAKAKEVGDRAIRDVKATLERIKRDIELPK